MLVLYTLGPRLWGQVYFDIEPPTGVAMTLLYGALCFFVGQIAHVRQQAEAARQANQRLLADLQVTHRQLQDYAAQTEEWTVTHERSRLARELHDSVTHTVFSMTLAVQAARLLFDKEPARVAAQIDRVQELAPERFTRDSVHWLASASRFDHRRWPGRPIAAAHRRTPDTRRLAGAVA